MSEIIHPVEVTNETARAGSARIEVDLSDNGRKVLERRQSLVLTP